MNRDLIFVTALAVIALLCLPILGMVMGDWTPPAIAQQVETPALTPAPGASVTPTPAVTLTPLPARVYVLPFRQALAINQTVPTTRTNFLLYENGTDVFQVIGQQNNFTQLQTLDGKLSFWVMAENVSAAPPTPAVYDFANRGKTIRLSPQTGYACLHEDAPPPVFAQCQTLPNFSTAKLTAKVTAGSVTYYLIEVEGRSYFIPPEVVLTLP